MNLVAEDLLTALTDPCPYCADDPQKQAHCDLCVNARILNPTGETLADLVIKSATQRRIFTKQFV